MEPPKLVQIWGSKVIVLWAVAQRRFQSIVLNIDTAIDMWWPVVTVVRCDVFDEFSFQKCFRYVKEYLPPYLDSTSEPPPLFDGTTRYTLPPSLFDFDTYEFILAIALNGRNKVGFDVMWCVMCVYRFHIFKFIFCLQYIYFFPGLV